MMKKSLLALAVATLGTSAFAQESNVTIYGTLVPSAEIVRVTNGAAGDKGGRSFQRIANQDSYIGFKGTEALGNGLKAIWQIESNLDISGNSGNSLGDGNTASGFGTRNTYVGLNGSFGTALLGRHETPYRLATKSFDVFSGSTADAHAIMGKLGGGNLDNAFDFYMRASNVVAYVSPNYNGFSGAIAYATNEDRAKDGVTGVETANTSAWSGMVAYTNSGWTGTVAYERRNAAQGGWNADVQGVKAGLGYSYAPGAQVGLVYEQLRANDVGAQGAKDQRNAFGVSIKHPINNFVLKAQYVQAGNYKDATGTISNSGARMYSLGADYNLSKRTALFAHYVQLDNKENANYNFTYASTTAGQVAGADSNVLGLGIRHSF